MKDTKPKEKKSAEKLNTVKESGATGGALGAGLKLADVVGAVRPETSMISERSGSSDDSGEK